MKCNAGNEIRSKLWEDFMRAMEVEYFARSVVQHLLQGGELLMADLAEVHPPGQAIARLVVDFFVGVALPRTVRIAKVDANVQLGTVYSVQRHLWSYVMVLRRLSGTL